MLYRSWSSIKLFSEIQLKLHLIEGAAFVFKKFKEYYELQNTEHITITTELPRGKREIERLNGSIISALSKLFINELTKRYKYVHAVQRTGNPTISRSSKKTFFKILMMLKWETEEKKIIEILEEWIKSMVNHISIICEEEKWKFPKKPKSKLQKLW